MKDLRKRTFNVSGLSFLVYSLSSIAISICLVNIKRDLNFSLTEAGLFGMLCAIEQMIILFISPIFAAKFGKIKVLRTSLLILAAGLFFFSKSINFFTALLSALCMGLGVANMEALLTPIVNDLYPNDTGAKMNMMHAFWPLGTCSGLIGFGYLLSIGINWRYIYIGLSIFALLICFSYPSSKKIKLPPSDGSKAAFKEIFSLPSFWLFGLSLFFAGGAEGAFAFWSATLIQLYLKASAFYAGIVTASFALGMFIGRSLNSKVLKKVSIQKAIIVSSIASFIVSLLFVFVNSLFGLAVFLFCMGLCLACLWPTIQSFAAAILPVDATALMIFLSCFGVPGYSTASFIMGIVGDKYDLFIAFITVVPVFLILVPILFIMGCKLSGSPKLKPLREKMNLLDKDKIEEVYRRFKKNNPNPKGELHSANIFTLLVAVVLSAQATDVGVNKATGPFFKAADTPQKMIELGEEGIREYIKTINLYPTKAKRIFELSRIIQNEYAGRVPDTMEELIKLPGVGRKTANVVLNMGFGKPAIAVDTHILRTAPRIGLSSGKTPIQVEEDLLKVTPKKYLLNAHHWILLHGRYICKARKPECETCFLSDICMKNL